MTLLQKKEGAILERKNPHLECIRTQSPSLNFTFGKGYGLPKGFGGLLYGPPKGGKTVISNLLIADALERYPDEIVIKFDAEMRERIQMTEEDLEKYGIAKNKDRYMVISSNDPVDIFDTITKDIEPMLKAGEKVSMIVIDSISSIRGIKDLNADSVEGHLMGDKAMTLQRGFERLTKVVKQNNIALVGITQIRAEFDRFEAMRNNGIKPAAPKAMLHYFEYFLLVEAAKNAAGKKNLLGESFLDEGMGDLYSEDKAMGDLTAGKISVHMADSSAGPKHRTGMFTFDFKSLSVLNAHEEVWLLGSRRGVIARVGNSYVYSDLKWKSKDAGILALKENPMLCGKIMEEIKKRDNSGEKMPVIQMEEEIDSAEE